VTRPLRILLLADDQKVHANTIRDHIAMFRRYSRHEVRNFNPRGLARSRFLDLDAFDVVVIHYSLVVIWDNYLAPAFREQIRRYQGLKVQFLQDEYRFVDALTDEMRRLGIDVLYSVVPQDAVAGVYGDRLPGTEILPALTGYVPERLVGQAVPPLAARPIDVGYRGRSLPFWLGRLGFEKTEIGRGYRARAEELGLRTDIEWTEKARIYGQRWNEFVRSCRTMLASESGASIVDYDGAVERAVRSYIAEHPSASYEEVERTVLNRFRATPQISTLSPRLFEAAALRTGLVMFPGEYAGTVQPWEHYIPLAKDFSNIAEVAERIRDVPFLDELTSRTYEQLVAAGRYSERSFVASFDEDMAERAPAHSAPGRHRESLLRLERAAAGRSVRLSHRSLAYKVILAYLGVRNALRSPPLRKLLWRVRRGKDVGGAASFWDDLFRIAVLTSVQRGLPVLACEPFRVDGRWDDRAGRLTLTSRSGNGGVTVDDDALTLLSAAARDGRLTEILWSHATFDPFVLLRFGPTGRRVAFDVGRYDAYGIYRFDALTALARERPDDVVATLAPLVAKLAAPDTDIDTQRGSRP
jgi:hypothetical protein